MAAAGNGKSVSEAVRAAVAYWAQRCWMKTYNQVVELLSRPQSSTGRWSGSGPMLRTRTGHLKKSVRSASKFGSDFFRLAVGIVYGVAWHGKVSGSYPNWRIAPTPRREFFVKPVRKKALSWIDPSSGTRRFSRGHMIPAGAFNPPRPFIAKPMMDLEGFYADTLKTSLQEQLREAFPDRKIGVTFKV